MAKHKLVFFLPDYDPDASTHLYYFQHFLRSLSEKVELLVIIDKCKGNPNLGPDTRVYLIKTKTPFLKLLEILVVLIVAVFKGFRTFYVHYHWAAVLGGAIWAWFCGGKTLYWNCGDFRPFDMLPVRSLASLRNKLAIICVRAAMIFCSRLVTGSPTMAAYYKKHYRIPYAKIRLVPNWLDLQRFQISSGLPHSRTVHSGDSPGTFQRPVDGVVTASRSSKFDEDTQIKQGDFPTPLSQLVGLSKKGKIILFVHRLSPRAGADFLVPLLCRVHAHLKEVFLVIAGDGPYRSQLLQDIHDAGKEAYVRVLGWVPNKLVPFIFRSADVFILPSRQDAFPRVLLEAMACDCPFVAFDVGGVRDFTTPFQHNVLVPREDIDAFGRKLLEVLSSDELRQALRAEGRQQVARFSEELVLAQFLRVVVSDEGTVDDRFTYQLFFPSLLCSQSPERAEREAEKE